MEIWRTKSGFWMPEARTMLAYRVDEDRLRFAYPILLELETPALRRGCRHRTLCSYVYEYWRAKEREDHASSIL